MHSCSSLLLARSNPQAPSSVQWVSSNHGLLRGMKALDLLPRSEDNTKESLMRNTKFAAGLLTLSLLLAGGAVAGNSNRGSLQIHETITVGGKQFPAGKYEVAWAGTGSDVELSISIGRDTVAKVPAQLLPLQKAVPS